MAHDLDVHEGVIIMNDATDAEEAIAKIVEAMVPVAAAVRACGESILSFANQLYFALPPQYRMPTRYAMGYHRPRRNHPQRRHHR